MTRGGQMKKWADKEEARTMIVEADRKLYRANRIMHRFGC